MKSPCNGDENDNSRVSSVPGHGTPSDKQSTNRNRILANHRDPEILSVLSLLVPNPDNCKGFSKWIPVLHQQAQDVRTSPLHHATLYQALYGIALRLEAPCLWQRATSRAFHAFNCNNRVLYFMNYNLTQWEYRRPDCTIRSTGCLTPDLKQ